MVSNLFSDAYAVLPGSRPQCLRACREGCAAVSGTLCGVVFVLCVIAYLRNTQAMGKRAMHTIALVSRKGGTGKSTLAIGLAVAAMARHGYHAISHAPGPRTQWRIRPHCPITTVVPSG